MSRSSPSCVAVGRHATRDRSALFSVVAVRQAVHPVAAYARRGEAEEEAEGEEDEGRRSEGSGRLGVGAEKGDAPVMQRAGTLGQRGEAAYRVRQPRRRRLTRPAISSRARFRSGGVVAVSWTAAARAGGVWIPSPAVVRTSHQLHGPRQLANYKPAPLGSEGHDAGRPIRPRQGWDSQESRRRLAEAPIHVFRQGVGGGSWASKVSAGASHASALWCAGRWPCPGLAMAMLYINTAPASLVSLS